MSEISEAIKARHSVRQYEEKPLAAETIAALKTVLLGISI